MTNKSFFVGILVIVLVFGLTVVGCDNESTNNNNIGNGGTFTLTNIPLKYDGMYAVGEGEGDTVIVLAAQNYNTTTGKITGVKISGNIVSIPMWLYNDANNSVSKYFGNDTNVEFEILIYPSSIADAEDCLAEIAYFSVNFSNGNVTKSWDEADDIWED